jgi:hypothetical protein
MRNKQVITVTKVSSLRDLARGVDGRDRRLRCASPAVNSVSSLRDLAGGVDGRCRRLRYASPAVNSVSSLRDLERGVDGRYRRLRCASPAVNSVPSLRDLTGRGTEEVLSLQDGQNRPCRGNTLLTAGFNPRTGTERRKSRRDGTLLTVITYLYCAQGGFMHAPSGKPYQ